MGKVKGRDAGPRWRPPAAEDINVGDILQYYSQMGSFQLQVLSLQHGGEWIFGLDTRDKPEARLGPVAVRRSDCMSLETAARILGELPSLVIDAPEAG